MSASSLSRALSFAELGDRIAGRREPSQLEAEVSELFEQMRNPVLRYLLSLGLPVDDGEEIVQEVFLALFRHLRHEKSRANLPGWIFRVAHNLGLKRRTSNAVHLQRHGEREYDACDLRADPAPNIEETLLTRQKAQRLRAALRTIPEQDRFCLYLRSEGLRYREIAEVLGISLGGVALSLQRSLERLRSAEGTSA